MDEASLKAAVESAYVSIKDGAHSPVDDALVHCFEAVAAMGDRVEEQQRVIDLYKSTEKSDLPGRLVASEDQNKLLSAALGQQQQRIDAMEQLLAQRASSKRWDALVEAYCIMHGHAMDPPIMDYVQALLASTVRH